MASLDERKPVLERRPYLRSGIDSCIVAPANPLGNMQWLGIQLVVSPTLGEQFLEDQVVRIGETIHVNPLPDQGTTGPCLSALNVQHRRQKVYHSMSYSKAS